MKKHMCNQRNSTTVPEIRTRLLDAGYISKQVDEMVESQEPQVVEDDIPEEKEPITLFVPTVIKNMSDIPTVEKTISDELQERKDAEEKASEVDTIVEEKTELLTSAEKQFLHDLFIFSDSKLEWVLKRVKPDYQDYEELRVRYKFSQNENFSTASIIFKKGSKFANLELGKMYQVSDLGIAHGNK